MKLLKCTYGTRRLLIIGLSGSELGGIRNSEMISTLDGVMGASLERFDYISILRAESEEQLRRFAEGMDGLVPDEKQGQPRPGLIEKPTGGDN